MPGFPPRLLPALAACALAAVAACTTMSPEERAAACANTDWQRYGLNDGTLGIALSERQDFFEDCAQLGQPADLVAYQQGRSEGLARYCTAENGYEVGYRGQRYHDVCPPELEPDFQQGYAQGRDDRPSYALYPSVGIGIGSGGVHSGVGIGVGVGGFGYGYDPFWNDCYYRDPFPCSWRHRGAFGHPWWW